jgi:hypothetical protein
MHPHPHPRISELLAYVAEQTAILRAAYDAVPAERRAIRPEAGRWSPAEVIHHLAIVERRLAQRVATLVEQARALPPETETSSVLNTPGVKMALDRTRRIVANEANEPRDTDPARVWDDLMDARRTFEQVVLSGDGLALGGVSLPHPALGGFNGYDWIAFVGSHVGRHADQIREMTPALAATAASAPSIARADP